MGLDVLGSPQRVIHGPERSLAKQALTCGAIQSRQSQRHTAGPPIKVRAEYLVNLAPAALHRLHGRADPVTPAVCPHRIAAHPRPKRRRRLDKCIAMTTSRNPV